MATPREGLRRRVIPFFAAGPLPAPVTAHPQQRPAELLGHEVVHDRIDGVVGVEQDAREVEDGQERVGVDVPQHGVVLEHRPHGECAVRRVAHEKHEHHGHYDLNHLPLEAHHLAGVQLQAALLVPELGDERETHAHVEHEDEQEWNHKEQTGDQNHIYFVPRHKYRRNAHGNRCPIQ